jgi:hypothetical protein
MYSFRKFPGIRVLIFGVASLLATKALYAQEKAFVLGVTERIQSKELSESRVLNVYLPDGYDTAKHTKYPVIYLLDGSADEDFVHIVGVVQFLTMIEAMPKTIVVGVGNVDRRRDFTFPTTIDSDKKAYPTTGGSARFMAFVEKELEPYVEHKYRTNDVKTIIGQSLGGLVATEILLKHPGLFNRYIIVSPSLWWDAESLLHQASSLLDMQKQTSATIYISVGTEGKQMEGDAQELVSLLKAHNYNTLFAPLPNEDHLTILHNSVYKALMMLNATK